MFPPPKYILTYFFKYGATLASRRAVLLPRRSRQVYYASVPLNKPRPINWVRRPTPHRRMMQR